MQPLPSGARDAGMFAIDPFVIGEPGMQVFRSDNPAAAFNEEEEKATLTESDRELAIVATAKQDPHAFAPLYRHYVGLVYHYALGRLRDPHRAEDATAATFTGALQALPSFNPEQRPGGTTFRSWLMTIARNTVIDASRRHPPTEPLDDARPVSRDPGPEQIAIASDQRDRIHAAIAHLPGTQRQIVELRLVGLRGAEIAEVLGMSPGAVKTANYRAFGRLRETLRESHDADIS